MESLSVKNKNLSLINNLIRIGDLSYFEGPLLTLFENVINGNLYLFDWVDRDEKSNRWLVYRVHPSALLNFMNNKISHFDLFESVFNRKLYIVDVENKKLITESVLQDLDSLPQKYLPNKKNYFNSEDCQYETKIRNIVVQLMHRIKQENLYNADGISNYMLTRGFSSIKIAGFNKIVELQAGSPVKVLGTHKYSQIGVAVAAVNKYNKKMPSHSNRNFDKRLKQTNRIHA